MWMERDRHEAEDLVQDTLFQALRSFDRYTPGTNCRAWLITMLHNIRSNRRRARFRRRAVEGQTELNAETVAFVPTVPADITDEDILAALKGIPEAYHHTIVLCDVEELTVLAPPKLARE